jgi:hypothetical protein
MILEKATGMGAKERQEHKKNKILRRVKLPSPGGRRLGSIPRLPDRW